MVKQKTDIQAQYSAHIMFNFVALTFVDVNNIFGLNYSQISDFKQAKLNKPALVLLLSRHVGSEHCYQMQLTAQQSQSSVHL